MQAGHAPKCDCGVSTGSWLSERALHACRKFRAVISTADFGRHSLVPIMGFGHVSCIVTIHILGVLALLVRRR
jgi:hypothetical protein